MNFHPFYTVCKFLFHENLEIFVIKFTCCSSAAGVVRSNDTTHCSDYGLAATVPQI